MRLCTIDVMLQLLRNSEGGRLNIYLATANYWGSERELDNEQVMGLITNWSSELLQ